jgi:hypothetical protein
LLRLVRLRSHQRWRRALPGVILKIKWALGQF